MTSYVPSTLGEGISDPRTESVHPYFVDMHSVDARKPWRSMEPLGLLGYLLGGEGWCRMEGIPHPPDQKGVAWLM